MRSRWGRVATAGLASILFVVGDLGAAGREAIVQTVDLVAPVTPVTVPIARKAHFVYELHLTNFLSVAVSLTRIQVLRADRSEAAIADYRGRAGGAEGGRPRSG